MKATIIIIGDEILLGRVADTNSGMIARALSEVGFEVDAVHTVGDSAVAIRTAVAAAMAAGTITVTTGGLGPTRDDITKSVFLDLFGGRLVHNAAVERNVEAIFERRRLPMNELTRSQAMVPDSCRVIMNTVGTAPVMWFEKDGHVLVAMPGVPAESRTMLPVVIDDLVERFHPSPAVVRKEYTVTGISESALAEKLASFEDGLPSGYKLAYLPSPGRIVLRLEGSPETFEANDVALVSALKPLHVVGGCASAAESVLPLLRAKGYTLATAESCTGGNVAALITAIPGCSDVFKGSVVAYCNEIKERVLGVDAAVLEKDGAVSEPTVLRMARGARRVLGADCAIATSGVAGPGGGTPGKPVGTVWIAVSTPCVEKARLLRLSGDRKAIVDRTAVTVLGLLADILADERPDAEGLYHRGREAWKAGDRARAISLYEEAAAIDPQGSAAVALEQARAIMNFYNKDLYNP